MKKRLLPIPASLLFILLPVACTLGPDYKRPETAADESASFVNSVDPAREYAENNGPWWTRFGDETTTKLVTMALENNTDLKMAAARVLEAEAAFSKSRSSLYPQLGYNLSGSHTKTSFVLPEMGRRTIHSTTYSAGLSLSYQIDLFGKLKRSRQSAWASFLSEEANRLTVEHSVIAGVVRSRVGVAQAAAALQIARDIRDSWEQTLNTIERRYRLGLARAVDLYLARENLASAEAGVTQLEASLKTARNGLDILLGQRPGSGKALPETLPELPDLGEIPAGIPASLLDRRPDLFKAEMQLAATTYGVGAALADLYPSLSLTGSGGTSSDSLSDLISTESSVYNIVGNILGPIFSGGARKAAVRAARARAEGAAAAYSGTILRALGEVENALLTDHANRKRLEENRRRLQNARSAAKIAQQRYGKGVEAFLKVLETERRLRNAEQAMISARVDTWNTRIDLFLALGGDWSLPEVQTSDSTESQEAPRENS